MANRRKFLAGLGALASGSAAAVGTGAFTSVQANRDVSVAVAGDSNAYLALDTNSATNSDYVSASAGEISINIDSAVSGSNTGSGVNPDSTTQINDLFKVRNQGTQAAVVYVDPESIASGNRTFGGSGIMIDPQASNRPNGDYQNTGSLGSGVEDDQISLTGGFNGPEYSAYQTSDSSKDTNGSGGNDGTPADALEEFVLEPGESFDFGLYVSTDDTVDSDSSISETIEIVADATRVPDNYAGDGS
ncbi:hypothetical protein PM030_15300 [Halorubrum ezzemoulense]|uniref:hypothetical protein n=1 Tax=Halorubrum ezzemoulense TaxID=337243 RepID=UPI00232EECAC|nr:hypothetical protein [Halorubrum ezzemoulense]MDB2283237.1 hypothetical protein [Halorubrum ezzemoulense]